MAVQPCDESAQHLAQVETRSASFRVLSQMMALRNRMSVVLKPLGLSAREYEILECLGDRLMSQSDIADELNNNKASISRSVRHLAELGLVVTEQPANDKRVSTVQITASGRAEYARARTHLDNWLSLLDRTLEPAERELLHRVTDSISRFVKQTASYPLIPKDVPGEADRGAVRSVSGS